MHPHKQLAMARVTLRVLDGADRGRLYADMTTPVTIGREEGNTIQLNDERVSRFHLKIQEDQSKLILTDLESTNGTKVNGEDTQLRILRFGDLLSVGRSVLLFGTPEQIAERMTQLKTAENSSSGTAPPDQMSHGTKARSAGDAGSQWADAPAAQRALLNRMPPELPEGLSPGQAAQLAELLGYVHGRLRELIASVRSKPDGDRMTLEARQWQELLDTQFRLASYLRSTAQPEDRVVG
jgi:pSer/pThr/pTyr-binding forkhead associated (FHA) protein